MGENTKVSLFLALALLSLLNLAAGEDLFTMKSNVSPLNSINFQKQIIAQRIRDVNIIFFYKEVGM